MFSAGVRAVPAQPALPARVKAWGYALAGSAPDELAAAMRRDRERQSRVIQALGELKLRLRPSWLPPAARCKAPDLADRRGQRRDRPVAEHLPVVAGSASARGARRQECGRAITAGERVDALAVSSGPRFWRDDRPGARGVLEPSAAPPPGPPRERCRTQGRKRKPVERRLFNPVIERLSRPALEALRWRRVQSTLARSYEGSPFYRRRLQQARVSPEQIRTPEDFRRLVPTVDKHDILADQREHPPLGTAIAVAPERLEYCFLTSGTSGKGQEVHSYTAADVAESLTSWASSLYWAGVMPGDTAFHMVPIGVTAGPVTLLNAFQRYGLRTFAVGAMEGEARLEMMRRFPPHFFSTGPVYLRRLTTICRELGIEPRHEFPALKAIKLGSFGFDVPWAREMEDFWGARLIDTYASTQCGGGIASTCEHGTWLPDGRRGVMHFPEHKVWAEVLNPATGEPAREDEEGEVILTSFGREAMPMLRFRTGDKVVFKSHRQCACGRPFDGIEAGTVSRYDSMLKIRGMNLWPEAVDAIVLAHPDIDEYNGRVGVAANGREVARVLVEFKLAVAADPAHRARVVEALRAQIKDRTGVGMEVSEARPGEVERFAYKEKRWKDQRRQQL